MKWNFCLLFYCKILKSIILWFIIFEFGLRTSAYEFFLQLQSCPIRVKMCEIQGTVKILVQLVIRRVKCSSYHGIWEEQAKEWEVFRWQRACFSQLQNTTYMEGTVLLIFPKDEVRRAHCWRFVRIHRPDSKVTNASVLFSLHFKQIPFKQSCYRQLLNSRNPLQWRCPNYDYFSCGTLESSYEQETNWKWAKILMEIILASHHCDLCDFAGTHDFGMMIS